ncbi:hypothetical protein QR98_0020950 [Sarcoptes scabiei]|uniref:Uncharacterized protein n=1 Tax=Sarcoptes scabiei TaxID=52283 RepID=A0A131ZYA5_SARSC|nr:hypothetical protein QR98_0020950 [Sarcoptes scabiei]
MPAATAPPTTTTTTTTNCRGKWSVVGSYVSAPIRGYYYPGRVKAIKKSIESPSTTPLSSSCPSSSSTIANTSSTALIYSVQFPEPFDSSDFDSRLYDNSETNDEGLILDYTADQLIGRGFEPITKALLSENQKVFITNRNRECSARVIEHDTKSDLVTVAIDQIPKEIRKIRLHEIRLLPSRKSSRIQEHPDYSLLASNGRQSPSDEPISHQSSTSKSSTSSSMLSSSLNLSSPIVHMNGRRQRTTSGSNLLSAASRNMNESSLFITTHNVELRNDNNNHNNNNNNSSNNTNNNPNTANKNDKSANIRNSNNGSDRDGCGVGGGFNVFNQTIQSFSTPLISSSSASTSSLLLSAAAAAASKSSSLSSSSSKSTSSTPHIAVPERISNNFHSNYQPQQQQQQHPHHYLQQTTLPTM